MAGDGTGLEIHRAGNRLRGSIPLLSATKPPVGSNPTPSATETFMVDSSKPTAKRYTIIHMVPVGPRAGMYAAAMRRCMTGDLAAYLKRYRLDAVFIF